jgi:hypothetical protein
MYTNIPSPFPDECLRGYGFRINAINVKKLFTIRTLLPELSKATGLTVSYLVNNHCHFSYTSFAHATHGDIHPAHLANLISDKNISSGYTPIGTARYCPHCIKEDINLYGTSYWHRVHHLPGVDHCIHHNFSLINANYNRDLSNQPLHSSSIESAISSDTLNLYFASESIKNFSFFSIRILNMCFSFDYFKIRNSIIERFHKFKNKPHINFSELAYEKFPPFWFNKNFHKVNSSEFIFNNNKILEASKNYKNIKPIEVYLILMALLWDDPYEAMRECL